MPSVGPELPPHLAKRKRSIDDDAEGPHSPPHKVQAAAAPEMRVVGPSLPPAKNPDEVELDDSSDDGYGPSTSAAKATSPPRRVVGPAMPPPKRVVGPAMPPSHNPDELKVDSSSDDDYGPSIPKSTTKPTNPAPKKRVLGPAPPPAPLLQKPSHPANPPDDSSSSDDDYAPSLPPAPGSLAEAAYLSSRAADAHAQELAAAQPAKPQRDEWMLVPPSNTSYSAPDPTKLKNRKFASGKGAKAPAEKTGISAIWTETPEEKRKRLEDLVLGRTDPSSSSSNNFKSGNREKEKESKQDEATARRIREYNEKNRGESLLEKRAREGGQKEEEDDPSQRGFDREKDMALGGRMGRGQKREMMAKAADFGSRFQKGSFL